MLTGKEPVSIREAARLVGRDVKAVHGDITALLNVGVLQKTEDNKIEFPFDQVHVDFILSDPAADNRSGKSADTKHVQRRNKTGQYSHSHESSGRISASGRVMAASALSSSSGKDATVRVAGHTRSKARVKTKAKGQGKKRA